MPAPDRYWAMTVASAAPAAPRLRPSTNHKSKPMFTSADAARNTSGATELPTARRKEAK